ncbi:tetratricopeptide repeat protein [Shewanella surugensis]|uniref:Tetratricopeptide repeat protein n=1 Tax=Shewanella surugensis TaxID=212020 RepID=A0ABT0LC42_9GAMM|nr:tetratricopeptide repeat protein [Shewanella surugensis]MCL1125233.1 tetratricopeptide repeat protein [Shewanella surugensis]
MNTEIHTCMQCHREQTTQWQASHHAKSMQKADRQSVLGHFNHFTFKNDNSWTLFDHDKNGFYIETGLKGQPGQRYSIPFVFGFYPLQQLLVDIGGGRLQAYTVAWDARSIEEGGQTWYDLYEDAHQPNSPFYWQGQFNNWNTRCAQCHSTELTRGYDLNNDRYNTQWRQPNVSCEACHGSASVHLALQKEDANNSPQRQLYSGFDKPLQHQPLFTLDPQDHTASLTSLLTTRLAFETHRLAKAEPSNAQLSKEPILTAEQAAIFDSVGNSIDSTSVSRIENHALPLDKGQASQCILCHSRRHTLVEGQGQGQINQEIIPRLALPRLYHRDGQIQDEVFVYGSFSQSKMAAAGVVCSHCHQTHSNELISQDNPLCTQCHRASVFDNPAHTLHSIPLHSTNKDTPLCIDCHMPSKTYMGVDIRRDHSFRIPNPWVNEALNSPNVCLSCHQDKDHRWTQHALASKKDAIFTHNSDIGTATLLNETVPEHAQKIIEKWVLDPSQAPMRRAVLLDLLDLSQPSHVNALNIAANDNEALVKLGVLHKLSSAPFSLQLQIGFGLLYDDNKNVRLEAIKLLSPAFKTNIPVTAQEKLQAVLKEAVATYQTQQDLLSGQLSLADLAYNVGDIAQAKVHYQNALQLQPQFLPAKLNLASLHRETGQYQQAKNLLQAILVIEGNHSLAQYNLGLIYVIEKQWPKALSALNTAANTSPDNLQFAFVYLLALEASGQIDNALVQLEKLAQHTPNDPALIEIRHRLSQSH